MATLITGLGYIGSALAKPLLERGDTVVPLENFFSTPRRPVTTLYYLVQRRGGRHKTI